jgi:SAM-dependent methyltransferase
VDVGCGTGVISQTILDLADPLQVTGIDAEPYLALARQRVQDARAYFEVGDAQSLPLASASTDATVSGLVLNFVADSKQAVSEMARVTRPGGVVAAYVWDYAGKMQLMRHFWNAAAALDPAAIPLDQGRRFPLCNPDALETLFRGTGLHDVMVRAIDIDTHFKDFDDYWQPFLGGQSAGPGYTMTLSEERRDALRERIRASLPFALDGSIPLVARAWAVRGVR